MGYRVVSDIEGRTVTPPRHGDNSSARMADFYTGGGGNDFQDQPQRGRRPSANREFGSRQAPMRRSQSRRSSVDLQDDFGPSTGRHRGGGGDGYGPFGGGGAGGNTSGRYQQRS